MVLGHKGRQCTWILQLCSAWPYREGKCNAHLNGDYQKIGDILLANMKVLKVGGHMTPAHAQLNTK